MQERKSRQWFYDGQWHEYSKKEERELRFKPLTLPAIPSAHWEYEELLQRAFELAQFAVQSPSGHVQQYVQAELEKLNEQLKTLKPR